jgi:hypothetical protein
MEIITLLCFGHMEGCVLTWSSWFSPILHEVVRNIQYLTGVRLRLSVPRGHHHCEHFTSEEHLPLQEGPAPT